MNFNFDDEDMSEFDMSDPSSIIDVVGFDYYKDLNQEYYSPFLRQKREYMPLLRHSSATDSQSRAEIWAEALNKYEPMGYSLFPEIDCLYRSSSSTNKDIRPIPAGVYEYCPRTSDFPERLCVKSLQREEEIVEIGSEFKKVREDIKSFRENEDVYTQIKTPYKLGILLYGPPGNGKSVFIRKFINDLKDAIVIYMDGDAFPSPPFLQKLNSNTRDQMKVFIFEELTSNTREWYIAKLLAFLDGENSLNRCITIATTNYPEILPENIVNRPSRFDKLYEFASPTETEQKAWLKFFMGREVTNEELSQAVKAKESVAHTITGFSVSALKELCLMVRINKLTLPEAAKQLKDRMEKCHNKFQKVSAKIGF